MPPSHRHNLRRRDDRGAAVVEFAVIMPLLMVILFGVVEFGIAINDYQSIRQGARDSARLAVVDTYDAAPTSCGINGAATTAPTSAQQLICATKQRTGLGDDVRVAVTVTSNPPEGFKNDTITICSTRNLESISGLLAPFIEGTSLRTEVNMRAEKDPGLAAGTYAETDPSGDNWGWC